jgi:ATP adenylyltransferase
MPVVGRTKVLPQLLGDTRRLFADWWPRVEAESTPSA